MKELTVIITDPIGLHARPASNLVTTATKFSSNIKLVHGTKEANLKSIMNVMALGVKSGAEVTFKVDGVDEEAALKAIEAVIEKENIAQK
ncbi:MULTISPECIES: HPr family phosphocarrier protein [unclassified Mycoplasma]|uniref:HPr family phosphocarrier protein n=1 Tax=unclassified Mycoplasma TaxID=2683645 RepID=UPI00211C4490|nr:MULTISPECIES: HPr family phosphocarrier protein [unclassified Mycoplasma]UUM19624.1 HPr family phosphocarrier protein [Mycoplasma sp. 1578d]UUM24593.1 HPr family phosphocarrier protein [Mycoplasma sp. 3686d]